MEVKWSSLVTKLVGINITNMGDHTCLDQSLLVDQIITNYLRPCYPCRSTLSKEPLEINTGKAFNSIDYRSVLSSLMYLCSGTRLDLSYSVNLLAQYSANPSREQWQELNVLIGYLKRTKGLGLEMKRGNGVMQLWSDANWGGEHKRLTSGYLVKHNGSSVAWGEKRQTVVALLTCAAEYIALLDGSKNLAHLHNLLIDIDQIIPLKIYCNNKAAILIASNNASKKKTQYLSCVFYFINDFICQYNIAIQWTNTQNQCANIFTKRLGPNLIEKALSKINLLASISQPREGVLECLVVTLV
jgi:hypothetical protein